jgi:hypothetical protein
MKAITITLVVISIAAAIVIFVQRSRETVEKTDEIAISENQFIKRIEHEIDSLDKSPNGKFQNALYEEINYRIDSYCNDRRLGETPAENEQQKENLVKSLYSVYVAQFIRETFRVFRHSGWEIADLNFIRNEYRTLRKSKLLEKDSPADQKFTEIQTILGKYDEITGFINACKSFSYSASGLSDRFPTAEMKSKMSRATSLNHNYAQYTGNCSRLRDGLAAIPLTLFRVHVRYLDNKIDQWSGFYSNYNSISDYENNLYNSLQSEIETLKNTYPTVDANQEYSRLSKKWNADYAKARNHYSK